MIRWQTLIWLPLLVFNVCCLAITPGTKLMYCQKCDALQNWLEVSDYFEDILSARLVDSQIKRPTISREEPVAKLKRDGLL